MMNALSQSQWAPGWRESTNVVDARDDPLWFKLHNALVYGLGRKLMAPNELRKTYNPFGPSVEQRMQNASDMLMQIVPAHLPGSPLPVTVYGDEPQTNGRGR